jgi:hypothetical protein
MGIDEPEDADQEGQDQESSENFGAMSLQDADEADQQCEAHPEQAQRGKHSKEPEHELGTDSRLRSRDAQVTGTTLGADLGNPRIHVSAWAEFDVVAPAAKVAVERFADGDSLTVRAVTHGLEK